MTYGTSSIGASLVGVEATPRGESRCAGNPQPSVSPDTNGRNTVLFTNFKLFLKIIQPLVNKKLF